MKEQADLWRDWNGSGNDNTYGRGGVQLVDYAYGTRWLARSYGNVSNSASAPYYTVQAAHDAVPTGGRLLMLGGGYGSFPETATLGGTGKSMAVQVLPDTGSAILGQ